MKDSSFARLKGLAGEVGQQLQLKNLQYGDSFSKAPKILEVLYPEGIRVEQYTDLLTIVRMLDKINRITGGKGETEDPYTDIAGYAILAQVLHEESKQAKTSVLQAIDVGEIAKVAKACSDASERFYKETQKPIAIKEQ